MIFITSVALLTLAIILIVIRWKNKECFKCAIFSVSALLGVLFFSNVLYTGYLNIDSKSQDERAAISLAICNPLVNVQTMPGSISCAPTRMIYGFDLVISSDQILSDAEVEKIVARVRSLKPIITTGRIQLRFKQLEVKSQISGITKEGVPYKSTSYTGDAYKTVDL